MSAALTGERAARLRAFIAEATATRAPPLTPELLMRVADEITPIWGMTEAALEAEGLSPPFWAFPWAGGQALARTVLDAPARVAGKRVLAFACGGGLEACAAARAGAAEVAANDLDPAALEACAINAALNGVRVSTLAGDLTCAPAPAFDVILAADVFYERAGARRILDWLRAAAAAGAEVLLADAARGFLPTEGLERVAAHVVPTPPELEDRAARCATVWRIPRV